MGLVRYGYQPDYARLARYLVCLAIGASITLSNASLSTPNRWILFSAVLSLGGIAAYQNFWDRTFQVPREFFAIGENLGVFDEEIGYKALENSLRTNGIYSEPSYLGMILTCVGLITIRDRSALGKATLLISLLALLICGSGLGLVGLCTILAISVWRSLAEKSITSITLIITIGLVIPAVTQMLIQDHYSLSALDRAQASGVTGDSSALVRFLYPFYLIYENIGNLDLLGIPFRTFEHFQYLGLYYTLDEAPLHNGLLSAVVLFGIPGLMVVSLLFRGTTTIEEFVSILIIGSQNGNLLSYEKILSLVFILLVLRGQLRGSKAHSLHHA